MPAIDLRVELPAYSHSFQVQVDDQWAIKDVKQEIQRVCKGGPQWDGQRLIWRGRFLKDEENVQDIWKSSSDSRIVHLSVHPSAWTGTPPSHPSAQPPAPSTSASSAQTAPSPPGPHPQLDSAAPAPPPVAMPPAPVPLPLECIHNKHNVAIHVLTHGSLPVTEDSQQIPRDNLTTRLYAVTVLHMYGYTWPSILDTVYPRPSDSDRGARYEHVTIDGQSYLSLATPDVPLSQIQQHALKVLAYTFPLLTLAPPDPTVYHLNRHFTTHYQQPQPTLNLREHIHQLGFTARRPAPAQNVPQNPADPNVLEVRAIPFRALMVPLMMLLIRTFLLVYFFSPSKRPVFGLILSAWIFYEAWGALRGILGDRPNNNEAGEQGRAANGAAGDEQAQRGQAPGAVANNNNANRPEANRSFPESIVETLATAGLRREEALLTGQLVARSPSIFVKARTFVILFISTLHPAVWDRRRNALRKREGRLRTEANVRQSPEVDEVTEPERYRARQAVVNRTDRRPFWLRVYVDRVLNTEYVDDI
ncbi:hypothetical protein BDW22DRAFT_1351753 [Trametopsis cervina]|nr:hypothetical protein BDW22DRAFT_1351753 [Trametopsis cervina]